MKTYKIISLSILLFLLHSDNPIQAQPGQWSDPVNVSNTDYGSSAPDMVMDIDEHIHLVWQEQIDQYNVYMTEIYYSEFNGEFWSIPIQISQPETTWAFDPSITVDSFGNPHVLWLHRAIFPDNEIYYSTRVDNIWTEPENLTPDLGTSYNPELTIDNEGRLHAFWVSYFSGANSIIHKINENGLWLPFESIESDSLSFHEIKSFIDEQNRIHLCCNANYAGNNNRDIFYILNSNGIWEDAINISNSDSNSSTNPAIALDIYQNPHIIWQERFSNENEEILYSYRLDNSWQIVTNISNSDNLSLFPSITITGQDTVCALFAIDTDTSYADIYYTYKTYNYWSNPVTFFIGTHNTYSSILCDEYNNLHAIIVSLIYLGNSDLFYTKNIQFSSFVSTIPSAYPNKFSLSCYPNPFNSLVSINLYVFTQSIININIYNIKGRLVKTLYENNSFSGSISTSWNGRDNEENLVSAGIYILAVKIAGTTKTIKLVYLK